MPDQKAHPPAGAAPVTRDGAPLLTAPGRPWNWGGTPGEVLETFPCDRWTTGPALALLRAVDVAAPAALVFRWLCQLRVAPYSYDWLDNAGRRSPRRLTPGADRLEPGQRFLIARLVSVQPGRHITGVAVPQARRLFGTLAATYEVRPRPGGGSRILVRLTVEARPGPLRATRRVLLGWGDLLMMRRQLLNLKALAERDAAEAGARPAAAAGDLRHG